MQRNNTTIQDVAREAGVSKTTAAAILRNQSGFHFSPATLQRVQETAARLGYRRNALAVALSSGRTYTVGILLPPLSATTGSSISNVFGQRVFVALFDAASRAGLRVMPACQPRERDGRIRVEDLVDGRIDGLIMIAINDPEFVERIYASGLPCVEMSSGCGKRLVHPDNEAGTIAAVKHLADLGHRRIAHWRGGMRGNHAGEQRLSAFQAAAALLGIAPEETLVVESGDALTDLLRKPAAERPTAVFAFNDHQAFMALDIARELGLRVPTDLSLVGFDDSIVAELARPRLTTVHNPLEEQADASIRVLQALWSAEAEPPLPYAVPTHLVVRQSTAPAPNGS